MRLTGKKIRDCKKENEQTHVEFARAKKQLFDRWCSLKKIGSDHEKLRQIVLVEVRNTLKLWKLQLNLQTIML